MKLYKYTFGDWELYGPANDDADAEKRKADVDPQFHYVPVTIEEVKLEGYEITVSPVSTMEAVNLGNGRIMTKDAYVDLVKTMDKTELKNALHRKNIEFHHALGEEKLRELVIQHI